MEDIDNLAKGLVDGTISCEGCSGLQDLVEKVKAGQVDYGEFKNILKMSKEQLLNKTV
jgi:hypothetical protein